MIQQLLLICFIRSPFMKLYVKNIKLDGYTSIIIKQFVSQQIEIEIEWSNNERNLALGP